MTENISYKLSELDNNKDIIDCSMLYNNFFNDCKGFDDNLDNDYDTTLDKIVAIKLEYITNYTVPELKQILNYYINNSNNQLSKKYSKKKEDIIDVIVEFESNNNNLHIVNTRKRLWFYINELKKDKYLSKYIIFN